MSDLPRAIYADLSISPITPSASILSGTLRLEPDEIAATQEYIRADLATAKDARIAELERQLAELERQLAEAREVKPLVWREVRDGNRRKGECFSARSLVNFAPIAVHKKHDGWWLNVDCQTYPTLEAAKAAAQADYTARILSALKGAKP